MAATKNGAGPFDLTGRVAVITGGASGIGLAYGRAFARAGASVILADINEEAAAQAAKDLSADGRPVVARRVDVSRPDTIEALFSGVMEQYGRIDIACANAGVSMARGPAFATGTLKNLDPAEWRKVLDINLHGTFDTVRFASAAMIAAGRGRIIVTASTASLRSDILVSYAYVVSKGALPNLVRQAAIELAAHNVTINAIAPGPIRTNLAGGRLNDADIADRVATAVPLGRVGEASELEGLALLLASDASSYITGVTIPVDGGMMAWGGAPATG